MAGVLGAGGQAVGQRFVHHRQGDDILLARPHKVGHVQLERRKAADMSARFPAVHPHGGVAVRAVATQFDPLSAPVLGHGEQAAITGRFVRRDGKTLHHPFARDLDVGPSAAGLPRRCKVGGRGRIESPCAGQIERNRGLARHRSRPWAEPIGALRSTASANPMDERHRHAAAETAANRTTIRRPACCIA